MSFDKHPSEDDEFWRDCITQQKRNKNYNTNKFNNIFKYYNNNNLNNSHNSNNIFKRNFHNKLNKSYSKTEILAKKLTNISDILNNEEQSPIKKRLKQNKSIENMVLMYNRSVVKLSSNRKKNLINNYFDKEYPFKPELNYKNKSLEKKLKDYYNKNIYYRGKKYQQKHLNKIIKFNYDKINNIENFKFTPNIENKNLNKVFKENNILNSDFNRLFYYRLYKAREIEKEKKNKIIDEVKKNSRINWENNKHKIKKYISQKDNINYLKTLHDILLNQK